MCMSFIQCRHTQTNKQHAKGKEKGKSQKGKGDKKGNQKKDQGKEGHPSSSSTGELRGQPAKPHQRPPRHRDYSASHAAERGPRGRYKSPSEHHDDVPTDTDSEGHITTINGGVRRGPRGRDRKKKHNNKTRTHGHEEQDKLETKHPGHNYTDPGRPEIHLSRDREDTSTLTKITLTDGKHIWLNIGRHTTKEETKAILHRQHGLNPTTYDLRETHQHKEHHHPKNPQENEERTLEMTGHLRGGGGAGKKRSGQNKPLIRAPPGLPSPSKGQKNGEGSGHNTSRGKASTDTATGYSSILDTETPTGDYQYTTPEPDWCPYTWDNKNMGSMDRGKNPSIMQPHPPTKGELRQ